MAPALLTLTLMSVLAIAASLGLAFLAQTSAEVARHVLLGVFGTFLNLLAHSLMIFYLLGKGKAVKEAVTENGLTGDYAARITRLRAPVFSRATTAMAVTMVTAIVGASVDVGVLSSWPHSTLAAAALVSNLAAIAAEISALRGSASIVDEVNRLLLGSNG